MIKILKIVFILTVILQIGCNVILISTPKMAWAADPAAIDYYPQVQIPVSGLDQTSIKVGEYKSGVMSSTLLAQYIKAFYDYGMSIVGILAAIVLMGGGLLWLTSAGNDSKITQAKELITGSVTGVVILFGSWIILNTINPDLLQLRAIKTKYVDVAILGCCQSSSKAEMINQDKCKNPAIFIPNARKSSDGTKCEIEGCCAYTNVNPNKNTSNYVKCVDTIKADCPFTQTGATGVRDFLKNEKCADVAKCADVTADCSSVKNSDRCANVTGNYYCYNGKCYENDGKEGEPCGTNGGECTSNAGFNTQFNLDIVDCYELNYEPDSGGRDCGSGLYCCYLK